MSESCKSCKYFKVGESSSVESNCLRHPPQVIEVKPEYGTGRSYTSNRFPAVGQDEWCGEYKEKKDA